MILLRYLSLSIGVLFIIISIVRIGLYIHLNPTFTEFGSGFIVGNLLIFILGAILLLFAKRLKKTNN